VGEVGDEGESMGGGGMRGYLGCWRALVRPMATMPYFLSMELEICIMKML
jgi:hypothetical protein